VILAKYVVAVIEPPEVWLKTGDPGAASEGAWIMTALLLSDDAQIDQPIAGLRGRFRTIEPEAHPDDDPVPLAADMRVPSSLEPAA
jgi:hypothetical protein